VNLAFVTNYEKTIYFHGIATRLEAAGHAVSWISPSGHWARWLRGQGVGAERILDLAARGGEWQRGEVGADTRARLAALEEAAGLRLNDVILMDRLLRDRPTDVAFAYLAVASRELERFLAERAIGVVFGEQTFAAELLTHMVCRARGIDLLAPHVVRIPTGRVGFFRGHAQSELVAFRDVTPADRSAAAEFLASFRDRRPQPDYFHRYAVVPMPKPSWPAKLVKHLRLAATDPYDETHFSPGWLVRKRTSEVLNAAYHRVFDSYWRPPPVPARPFVLLPLHRQPEASIDVLGARVSNQIELVKALARTLPATHELYVKEHPNGRGDRGPREAAALRAIPGVRLVDPAVSTFALIESAALTLSLTGTAAYEAALLGRPAASIVPMFFGPILRANGFNPYARSLDELLSPAPAASDEAAVELLAHVIAHSFPGTIDNPLFAPGVLDEANLAAAAKGFDELLRGARWSRPR
jgi:hypothetical protein